MATNNSANYRPTQYNVQSGGASGTLNNIAPSATSGVPLIAQGAASQPIFGTALVAGGGTGITSATAYAVLCGGTTATGAFQSIAGVGTSTHLLTSNGAGALPTFQVTTGKTRNVFYYNVSAVSLTDAATYYMVPGLAINSTTVATTATTRIYMPVTGTINIVYGAFKNLSVGSNENCTLALRKNNTTDTNISTTIQLTATDVTFNNTSLGISITAGDFIQVKFISPTWATNPSSSMSLSFILE